MGWALVAESAEREERATDWGCWISITGATSTTITAVTKAWATAGAGEPTGECS